MFWEHSWRLNHVQQQKKRTKPILVANNPENCLRKVTLAHSCNQLLSRLPLKTFLFCITKSTCSYLKLLQNAAFDLYCTAEL